uniref:Uncharacterized protein n=1 Tax=Arundo donax TaxID=35708 RepID=A0A0A9AHR2_ARUDO
MVHSGPQQYGLALPITAIFLKDRKKIQH